MATDEVSLKATVLNAVVWFRYLLSKWYIIFCFVILGSCIGYFYAKSVKPIYTATTTFVLENEKGGGLSQYSGMAAMVGLNLGGGNSGGIFQENNIQALYQSRVMLEKALLSKTYPDSSELLIERFIAFNKIKQSWIENEDQALLALDFNIDRNLLDVKTLRLRDSVMSSIAATINRDMLKVGTADKKTSILKIDVESIDETFSKTFNEAIVAHVNEFYVQTKTSKSLKTIEILESKVDSVRGKLTGAIYSSANLLDATPNLNPIRQSQRTAPTQQAQFSADVNKAILSQLVQNLELSKTNILQEEPLIQVVDQPFYPLVKESKNKLIYLIFGGILFGSFSIFLLIGIRLFKNIMK